MFPVLCYNCTLTPLYTFLMFYKSQWQLCKSFSFRIFLALTPPVSPLFSQVKALTLFVTHYPPLCELERVYPEHVSNYHMAFLLNEPDVAADTDGVCVFVCVWDCLKWRRICQSAWKLSSIFRQIGPNKFLCVHLADAEVAPEFITFLYQLTEGAAGRSYGLNVARLADIPDPILHTAARKARELESTVNGRRYGSAWPYASPGCRSWAWWRRFILLDDFFFPPSLLHMFGVSQRGFDENTPHALKGRSANVCTNVIVADLKHNFRQKINQGNDMKEAVEVEEQKTKDKTRELWFE